MVNLLHLPGGLAGFLLYYISVSASTGGSWNFVEARSVAPTTPVDPFRLLARAAPKKAEEPVCCLRRPPLQIGKDEREDEEPLPSFEEWKRRRRMESALGRSGGGTENDSALAETVVFAASEAANVKVESSIPTPTPILSSNDTPAVPVDVPTAPDSSPSRDTKMPAPPSTPPLTDRFNYASLDCSARVHAAHKGARSVESILSKKKDRYMLSPCSARDQFVVVELCDDVRIDTVQLANFEFFSGVFRSLSVRMAKTYVTNPDGWTFAGNFMAKNVRGVQSFHPTAPGFYRYIRIDFHSHYGTEYYCPVSLLRVYGLTHLEAYKHEMAEAEHPIEAIQEQRALPPTPMENNVAEIVGADSLISEEGTISGHVVEQSFSTRMDKTTPAPHASAQPTPHTLITSTSVSTQLATQVSTFTSTSVTDLVSASTTELTTTVGLVTSTPKSPISDAEPTLTSDSANLSQIFAEINTSSAITTPKLPPLPTLVPTLSTLAVSALPPFPSPASPVGSGESIYRTIMNRLSALEANSTLYARYVEAHTAAVRDALRRTAEDAGRLDGLLQHHARALERILDELDDLRTRELRARTELAAKVAYLADEVLLEKRLGIAQLILMLAVLIFMALTRGSPAHPLPRVAVASATAQPVGSKGGLGAAWRRRTLSLTGDWGNRQRSQSIGDDDDGATTEPASPDEGLRTPTRSKRTLPITMASPQTIPSEGMRTPVTNGRKHAHFFSPQAEIETEAMKKRSTNLGTPTRRLYPQRVHSGSVLAFAGVAPPMTRSARRWARSAHVHEVRRGRASQSSSTHSSLVADRENVPRRSDGSPVAPVWRNTTPGRRPFTPLHLATLAQEWREEAQMSPSKSDDGDPDAWVDTDMDVLDTDR